MTELSRRAVLSTGGRAAVATFALGGLAVAAPALVGDDPIYAAIEVHREVRARWEHANAQPEPLDDKTAYAFCDEDSDAAWAMLDVEPTTVAGVGALLAYVGEHKRRGNIWPSREFIPETDLSPEYLAAHPTWDHSGDADLENDSIAWAARALTRLTGDDHARA